LQGDEPFVPIDLLKLIQNDFNKNTCDVITASQKITNVNDLQNPNCVKVHTTNNYADDFQRICKVNTKNASHHLGIYGYRLSTLNKLVELTPTERELELKLEQLRFMDNNFSIYVSSYTNTVQGGIDTQEDVDNAILYLKNL
jgi:3-deoxy-manno-octulosonate cytidylyltransferase (CMP-KDO synthetase)